MLYGILAVFVAFLEFQEAVGVAFTQERGAVGAYGRPEPMSKGGAAISLSNA